MKKLATLIFVVMVFILSSSNALANYPNEPDGFRGIKWGTDITDVKATMRLHETETGISAELVSYERVSDTLVIGNAQISSIRYTFWRGKFSHPVIKTTGYTNWLEVKRALESTFGLAKQSNNYYFWLGDSTSILTQYDKNSNEGRISFFSEKIDNQRKEWSKKQSIIGAGF